MLNDLCGFLFPCTEFINFYQGNSAAELQSPAPV